jgi:hypothetical protein
MTKNSSLTQSKRSGGPQTDEGKKVSSRNSIKTGAYSKVVILPGEDEAEYRELEEQFMRDFAPRDIAEGAMVRELTVLTWKKIRLDQLEHRKVLQTLSAPLSQHDLDKLFLFRPDASWVTGSLDSLTQAYVDECWAKRNMAHELLQNKVTPQALDSLKKKFPALYADLMQEVDEYGFEDRSHMVLCEENIADGGKLQNLMHFLLDRQIHNCEDIIWAFENLEAIQKEVEEIKDTRLISLMQNDRTGRAREDLSRSFFRTLSELRKHQHWRYQRDAVDVSPPVDEDN